MSPQLVKTNKSLLKVVLCYALLLLGRVDHLFAAHVCDKYKEKIARDICLKAEQGVARKSYQHYYVLLRKKGKEIIITNAPDYSFYLDSVSKSVATATTLSFLLNTGILGKDPLSFKLGTMFKDFDPSFTNLLRHLETASARGSSVGGGYAIEEPSADSLVCNPDAYRSNRYPALEAFLKLKLSDFLRHKACLDKTVRFDSWSLFGWGAFENNKVYNHPATHACLMQVSMDPKVEYLEKNQSKYSDMNFVWIQLLNEALYGALTREVGNPKHEAKNGYPILQPNRKSQSHVFGEMLKDVEYGLGRYGVTGVRYSNFTDDERQYETAHGNFIGHSGIEATGAGLRSLILAMLKRASDEKSNRASGKMFYEFMKKSIDLGKNQMGFGYSTGLMAHSARGNYYKNHPKTSIGHVGFEGTSYWMIPDFDDPEKSEVTIVLTDRFTTMSHKPPEVRYSTGIKSAPDAGWSDTRGLRAFCADKMKEM